MGERGERRNGRWIRAAIGSVSAGNAINATNAAVSAKPGLPYWSGQQPQCRW
jgi:hypothetical protein